MARRKRLIKNEEVFPEGGGCVTWFDPQATPSWAGSRWGGSQKETPFAVQEQQIADVEKAKRRARNGVEVEQDSLPRVSPSHPTRRRRFLPRSPTHPSHSNHPEYITDENELPRPRSPFNPAMSTRNPLSNITDSLHPRHSRVAFVHAQNTPQPDAAGPSSAAVAVTVTPSHTRHANNTQFSVIITPSRCEAALPTASNDADEPSQFALIGRRLHNVIVVLQSLLLIDYYSCVDPCVSSLRLTHSVITWFPLIPYG